MKCYLFASSRMDTLVKISTETEKCIWRILKIKFSKYFCISVMLLTQIMGKCCGPCEFFCLRGQYYGLGHPNVHQNYIFTLLTTKKSRSKFFACTSKIHLHHYFVTKKVHQNFLHVHEKYVFTLTMWLTSKLLKLFLENAAVLTLAGLWLAGGHGMLG